MRATALDHAHTLRHTIATRTVQTNEANRCVYVAAMLNRACADVPVSYVSAEPQGCIPGLPDLGLAAASSGASTILGAHQWRDGRGLPPAVWGDAHPHGNWVRIR